MVVTALSQIWQKLRRMGDSDEEFDNRRSGREKFQRERPADSGRDRRSNRDAYDNDRSSDRNRTRSDKWVFLYIYLYTCSCYKTDGFFINNCFYCYILVMINWPTPWIIWYVSCFSPFSRRDNDNYRDRRPQRDRYSQSPPQKRMRRDWYETIDHACNHSQNNMKIYSPVVALHIAGSSYLSLDLYSSLLCLHIPIFVFPV